jgi:bifunctional non-homologous end joining protein LigD
VYGPIGAVLGTGYKVQGVDIATAQKEYDKLIAKKMKDQYKPVGTDGPSAVAVIDKVDSGIRAQLLNPISEDDVEKYINDPDWGMQEKFDGKHMTLNKSSGITAINKKGFLCSFPSVYADALNSLKPEELVLDGEDVKSIYYIFDILSVNGEDLRKLTYLARWQTLQGMKEKFPAKGVFRVADMAITTEEKRAMFERLKAQKKEGCVFKRLSAKFKAGRPGAGGDMLKCKFYATASFVVRRINDKSSIGLGMYDDKGALVDMGNCTVLNKTAMAKIVEAHGSSTAVCEVRYLYCYKGGKVYQPVYLGLRDDVDADECLMTQLKYKAEDEDEVEPVKASPSTEGNRKIKWEE